MSALVGAALASSSVSANAERRVALIIGNSAYKNVVALPNPARDAAAVAAMFKKAGFEVVDSKLDLGNTAMRAMNNTWDHYQDNRVQWTVGTRAHLRAYVAAGFAGFLFGRGADGATCACDAAKDGITNPAPIDGNTRASLSADDDGGLFKSLVRAYYGGHALALPR